MIPLLVLLSLVVYRVTRFLKSDSLIEDQRLWLQRKLSGRPGQDVKRWRLMAYDLISCHYCLGIWVSAGAVAVADAFTSIPLPVYVWLAAAGGAQVIWRWTEE